MTDMTNIVLAILTVGFLIFVAASAFGFGPGGIDEDELEEAKELLADEEAKFVDVRTPREFSSNGLEGAENIPVQELTSRLDEFGEEDEPIVLYCRSGARSAQATQILEQEGYEEIYDLGAHRTARQVVEEAHNQ